MRKFQAATFFILIFSILFLIHLVVYESFVSIFKIDSGWPLAVLRFLIFALPVAFIASIFVSTRYNNAFSRALYKIGAVWLGFSFYFFWSATAYGLVAGLFSFINPGADLSYVGRALVSVAAGVTIYGYYNAKKTLVKRIKIKLPNLPETWKNKTVVLISDLHLGIIQDKAFLARTVEAVMMLKPAVVFIVGDLFDGVKVDTQDILQPLKNLKAEEGVYFVTGNHDGFYNHSTEEYAAAIRSAGIRILDDEVIDLDGVQLAGVDYGRSTQRSRYAEIISKLNIAKDRPSILLKHVPSEVDIPEQAGVTLQLSGHTHRAQVQPLSFIPGLVYKGFDYGLRQLNGMQIFTSSGVGTWGPPYRVGTNSEIVLLDFE